MALGAVFVAGGLLRLPCLSTIPDGLIPDEALQGYDAWSIARTGRDSFGEWVPLFPQSMMRLHSLYMYLELPSVAILGLNEVAIRLPAALAGLGTVILLFLLLREAGEPGAGLLAAGSLALSPWHILMSRTGVEWILLPFMTSLTVLLAARAFEGRGSWAAAGVAAGLSLYTYTPVRLVLPLLFLGLAVAYRDRLPSQRRGLLAGGAVAFCVAVPVLASVFLAGGLDRLSMVRQEGATTAGFLLGLLRHYLAAFHPSFFLAGAGAEPELHRLQSTGLFHAFEPPLIVAGLWRGLRLNRPLPRLLAFWFLVAPLSVSIHKDAPDPVLSLTSVPAPHALAGLGAAWLATWLCERGARGRLLLGGAGVVVVLSVSRMTLDLYQSYPVYSAPAWTHGAKEAVAVAESRRHEVDGVVVDGRQKLLYSLILFYLEYDPARRQQETAAAFGRSHRSVVGAYRIGPVEELVQAKGRHLVWTTRREGRRLFPGLAPVHVVRWPDGRANYALYLVDRP